MLSLYLTFKIIGSVLGCALLLACLIAAIINHFRQ